LAERDVIAEVVVKDKERYAAEFVPIVSKAHQDMGGRLEDYLPERTIQRPLPGCSRAEDGFGEFSDTDTRQKMVDKRSYEEGSGHAGRATCQ
jgi:hypothetical protein